MTPTLHICAIASFAFLLAACGSAPKEHFYTLSDAASAETTLPSQDYSVVVGPVSVPELVDRPQFVLRMPGSEVRIAEQARWAEPLRQGIARAVAANLAQGLNNGRVYPGSGEADYRVILEVQRFDSRPAEAVTLEVMWTIRRSRNGEQQSARTWVKEPVAGQGYEELVAAHGRALAGVSRSIADAIRSARQNDVAAAATNPKQ